MKLLLWMLIIQTTIFAQTTIEEYEKQIDSIKDEKLKEAVRQKIAQKIADEISQTGQAPAVELPPAPASENTYTPPAENVYTPPAEIAQNKRSFNFVLGLNGGASSIDLGNVNMEITSTIFEIGVAQYIGDHRLRYTFLYHDQEVESFEDDRNSVKISDLDHTITYKASGIGFGYSYFVNNSVGFGGFLNYAVGDFEVCEDYGTCEKDEVSLFELGARVDFKVSAWSPFISVGSSKYTDSDGETLKGTTVYVGLLNFEF